MNDKQHPEWLQREIDDHRAREAADRLKVGIAALFVGGSGILALAALARSCWS